MTAEDRQTGRQAGGYTDGETPEKKRKVVKYELSQFAIRATEA